MTKYIKAMQVDRDAAADLCERIENDKGEAVASWAIDLIRAGKADHHCTVQAFARHRSSSTASSVEDMPADLLERAKANWHRFFYPERSDFHEECGHLNHTIVPLAVADSLREVLNWIAGGDATDDPRHIQSIQRLASLANTSAASSVGAGWTLGASEETGAWATSPDSVTVSEHMLKRTKELAERVATMRFSKTISGDPWESDTTVDQIEPNTLARTVLPILAAFGDLLAALAASSHPASAGETLTYDEKNALLSIAKGTIKTPQSTRAEIIEECAKAAEGYFPRHNALRSCGMNIATAIRALSATPAQEGEV